MFGFVVADRSKMTPEQLDRYQGCYCGLCQTIGIRHGNLKRAALNYDMTFLVLLLSSLYEPDEVTAEERCIVHPFQRHSRWYNTATEYAADMNMALAYHNCMDDWRDDKKIKSLFLALLFRSSANKVCQQYPEQWTAITTCLERLKSFETENLQNSDACANTFGELMASIFCWKNDRWTPLLYQMGHALGRFVYLMDAVIDLNEDITKNHFNPLRSRANCIDNTTDFLPILKLMIGECTDAFERLPLIQDVDLMRNILYSGVWCRFFQRKNGGSKEEHNHV